MIKKTSEKPTEGVPETTEKPEAKKTRKVKGWVTVSLGKENLEKLETISSMQEIAVSAMCKSIIIDWLRTADIPKLAKMAIAAEIERYRKMGLSNEELVQLING